MTTPTDERGESGAHGSNYAGESGVITKSVEHESVDWQALALAMFSLLDRIEKMAGDEMHVRLLCGGRFTMLQDYGLEVEFSGETSSMDH